LRRTDGRVTVYSVFGAEGRGARSGNNSLSVARVRPVASRARTAAAKGLCPFGRQVVEHEAADQQLAALGIGLLALFGLGVLDPLHQLDLLLAEGFELIF
jgi:hypothetical protein